MDAQALIDALQKQGPVEIRMVSPVDNMPLLAGPKLIDNMALLTGPDTYDPMPLRDANGNVTIDPRPIALRK